MVEDTDDEETGEAKGDGATVVEAKAAAMPAKKAEEETGEVKEDEARWWRQRRR